MNLRLPALSIAAALLLGGCVSVPTGPTVMVLPGPNKNFQQFQSEDLGCRQYARDLLAPAGSAAQDRAASSAILGTAIGAAAGAAIGAASGQPGSGAAIGAGTGLLVGSAAGSDGAYGSSYEMQRQFDTTYMQCMYAQGNQLPRQFVARPSAAGGASRPSYPPYPPPNMPPPQGYPPR